VVWDDAQLALAQAGGVGVYTVDGDAGGAKVTCTLSVSADNYLQNPGFEDEDMSMWAVENVGGKTAEVYRALSVNDIKSGSALFHFYDPAAVEFRIEQKVTGLAPGKYDFSLYIHGGDAQEQDMYLYAVVDGQTVATVPMAVTKWQEWQHPTIAGIDVTSGEITVGAYVKATGSGPWGKLDDWMLCKSR
jgi:arabinogalactan endo-1,4-beta-galactosidase